MTEDPDNQKPPQKNLLSQIFSGFDGVIKKYIPSFNVRAILYISFIFAIAVYLQIWRIHTPSPANNQAFGKPQETVIADDAYWQSTAYQEKIQTQTVQSFTSELENFLRGNSQEFFKRKFEDIMYINNSLTPLTGGDLTTVVPENFNYLENNGKARYQYAKANGFLNNQAKLVSLGTVVCDLNDKTEKATGIELYDWRYASMTKLAEFMKTNPDWKVQVGDKILDVSEPMIEDKDILKFRNVQNQPAGLFSFLIFHDPKTNRIFFADSTILESNAIDAPLTLSRISNKWDKFPKLYFKYGYEGCSQINSTAPINYGQSN